LAYSPFTLNAFLQTPLEYLKGIGKAKAELLQSELNLHTVGDLLTHYPFRYVDRSQITPLSQAYTVGQYVQVRGKVHSFVEEGTGARKRLKARFYDSTGAIELIWFKGHTWIREILIPGNEYVLFGKISAFKNKPTLPHPEIEKITPEFRLKGYFQPIYSTTEKLTKRGLASKGFEKLMDSMLKNPQLAIEETLPEDLKAELKLIDKRKAIQLIHLPQSDYDIRQAQRRLKFEELFFLQLELILKKELRNKKIRGFKFEEVGPLFNEFYDKVLPFELTGAQKRVLKEIRRDLKSGQQMNRLLQGDVGSGKTIVATLTALLAIDNGFQASIMAPTEILATQHYESLRGMLEKLGLNVELLTGSTKKAKRREIDEALLSGELNVLIGTHAILEKRVKFKNLGLAIIDEQHRFGVAQRAKMWLKNQIPPHILVMTATPIPRTLAMTLYGDLEVSVIDELPPGRKPVRTEHAYDSARIRLFGFMEKQIKLGRQVYIVYPLIEESSSLDLKDLMDGYESIERRFPKPEYQVSIVHGKMKPQDKEFEMNRFVRGETQIMVATTVIEVGVNVPNASVMIIESAQRFGLSQLHQLRGRVGRGADQSYCILVSDYKLSNEAKKRLKIMTQTNDGFKIAEEDLKLRGPGDILGTQQSGILDLKLADLSTDSKILVFARNAALELIEDDPDLEHEKNEPVAKRVRQLMKEKPNWSRIS
jgi:ATP-dependent DNA helicase RecG